jgi:uncharacterized protein (TIGR02271 family)
MDNPRSPASGSVPGQPDTLEIKQEEAEIQKSRILTGSVKIRTLVETFEDRVAAEVERQDVEITRVPVGRVVTTRPDVRFEDDMTIIPILEEELVVEKRLILREELHIRRKKTSETIEMPVMLRRDKVNVEHVPANDVKNQGKDER